MYKQSVAQENAAQAGAGLWTGDGNGFTAFFDEKVERACAVQGCMQPGRHRVNARWACSGCLELVLGAALIEEQRRSSADALHASPRTPLGQILLDRGAVSEAQLAEALDRQRAVGAGRLGCWLKQAGCLSDHELTAALAVQGRCPVFNRGSSLPAAECLPKPLMERFHVVPVLVGGLPALAFEDFLPAGLHAAVERMHGAPVSVGVLAAMDFWWATREVLSLRAPRVAEAHASSLGAWARAAAWVLADGGPLAARLVAVGDCCWLRFSHAGGSVRDFVCTVDTDAPAQSELNAGELDRLRRGIARVLNAA